MTCKLMYQPVTKFVIFSMNKLKVTFLRRNNQLTKIQNSWKSTKIQSSWKSTINRDILRPIRVSCLCIAQHFNKCLAHCNASPHVTCSPSDSARYMQEISLTTTPHPLLLGSGSNTQCDMIFDYVRISMLFKCRARS